MSVNAGSREAKRWEAGRQLGACVINGPWRGRLDSVREGARGRQGGQHRELQK